MEAAIAVAYGSRVVMPAMFVQPVAPVGHCAGAIASVCPVAVKLSIVYASQFDAPPSMKALPNNFSGTFPLPDNGAAPLHASSPDNTSGAGEPVALGGAAGWPSGRVLAVSVYVKWVGGEFGVWLIWSSLTVRETVFGSETPAEHAGSQVAVGCVGRLRASTFVVVTAVPSTQVWRTRCPDCPTSVPVGGT